jgi:hypothetical protein
VAVTMATIVGGLFFGVIDRLTSLGPNWALDLSNVAAFWLAAAFVAGMSARTRAEGGVLGTLCLASALFGYYGYMYFGEHVRSIGYLQWRAAPWVAATIIVGPLFGALGEQWRWRRSSAALCALAAAFCLDGLGYAMWVGWRDPSNAIVHLAVVAIGLVLATTLLVRRRRTPSSTPPH